MDVYVIPDVKASVQRKTNFAARLRAKEVDRAQFAIELVACAILLAIATFVGFQIDKLNLGESNLVMSYMLAVILTAGFSRYWMTGVASSQGAVLLYNFFFTEPRFTMQATAYYPFTFLAMLVCALTVSSLAAQLKNQARMSREESKKLQVLIAFSNKVNLAAEPGEVLRVCAEQVMHLLNRSVVIYGTDAGKANLREVFLREGAGEEEQNVFLSDREQAVAYWVMKNCHRAGRTTDTLPEASGCYFPVKRDGVVYGVVGIRMEDNDVLRADDRNLLYVLLDETAVALKACKIHGGRYDYMDVLPDGWSDVKGREAVKAGLALICGAGTGFLYKRMRLA